MKASKSSITVFFVVSCLGIAFVVWSAEPLSWKVDGVDKRDIVQGVITKIEGNKITLKQTSGKLLTLRIKGESTDDKHKEWIGLTKGLLVGDAVKIQNGKLTKIKEPVKPDSGKIFPKVERK